MLFTSPAKFISSCSVCLSTITFYSLYRFVCVLKKLGPQKSINAQTCNIFTLNKIPWCWRCLKQSNNQFYGFRFIFQVIICWFHYILWNIMHVDVMNFNNTVCWFQSWIVLQKRLDQIVAYTLLNQNATHLRKKECQRHFFVS